MRSALPSIAAAAAAFLLAFAPAAHSQGAGGGPPGGGGTPGGGGPPGGGTPAGCAFDSTGTVGLNFGTVDPSIGGILTATATVMVGDCPSGQTMVVTVDDGQRMNRTMIRDGGSEVIPYSLSAASFSPSTAAGPGVGAYKPARFTGTLQPSAYMDAMAGTYRDILIVTVTP